MIPFQKTLVKALFLLIVAAMTLSACRTADTPLAVTTEPSNPITSGENVSTTPSTDFVEDSSFADTTEEPEQDIEISPEKPPVHVGADSSTEESSPEASTDAITETTPEDTTETIPETTPEESTSSDATVDPDDMPTYLDVFVPYDVPLTYEQQQLAESIASRFNIRTELVFGVMFVESKYNVNAIGKNGNYLGIMQVAKSNLNVIPERYGVKDLMNYEDCVIAGSYFLSHYDYHYNHDLHIMLLFYHGGPSYGSSMLNQGITEDAYTRAVVREMNRIIDARRQLAEEMGVRLDGFYYQSA